MTFDLKSWLTGFALGLAGKPFPLPQGKEPVAYLYGHVAKEGETPTHTIDGVGYVGAVLPDIRKVYTEEVEKQYPYAIITSGNKWTTRLYISVEPSTIMVNDYGDTLVRHGLQYYTYYPSADGSTGYWGSELQTTTLDANTTDFFVWSNHDVYNGNTLVFAKTEPIPVYE